MDPTPELLSLPDVPSRAIVSLLPLQQLIASFPLVHPRFSSIRASVLRGNQRLLLHLGNQKETQKLKDWSPVCLPFAGHLLGSTGVLLYPHTYPSDFYRLHLATLDSDSVEQLSTHMPAITHLEVILASVDLSVLSHLTLLLTKWAPTLRTLKLLIGLLSCKGVCIGMADQLPSFRLLFNILNNNATSLEHLTLFLQGDSYPNESSSVPSLPLPVLGRLREFNFFAGGTAASVVFILDALRRYASKKLTHIGLPGLESSLCQVDLPALGRHQLAVRFTQIPFNKNFPLSVLTAVCPSFPNLRECSFNCDIWTSVSVMAGLGVLSTLSNLQFLHLQAFPFHLPHLVANFAQLSPLKSVKVLLIQFKTRDGDAKQGHDRLVVPYWATLFPGVQIVRIALWGRFCGDCYPDENENARETIIPDYAQVTPCLTQLLAPLKVLPSLRKIFYKFIGIHSLSGPTAEFTPDDTFVRTHEHVC